VSLYAYRESLHLGAEDFGFHALIMAAMRKADSDNIERLKAAFPETWEELRARYNAPGGLLPGESDITEEP
jgi:hypothetical protein